MLLFLIKKAFFDGWDHLFRLLLLNIGAIAMFVLGLSLVSQAGTHPGVFLAASAGALLLWSLYLGPVSCAMREISDYHTPSWKDLGRFFTETWKSSLVFGITMFLQLLLAAVIFPWYLNLGGVVGLAIMGLLFWMSVIWWCASQFYFPIMSRIEKRPHKILLKCLLFFFDNTGFSIFLALGTLLLLLVSSLTIFLFPGVAGILLWHQAAFKLRFYKYDYLETHPDANRKKIPWETLLQEDRVRVGPRTLRNLIFPWKE